MFGLTKYLYAAMLVSALVAFAGWQGYRIGNDKINALWLAKQADESAQATQRMIELQNDARAKESLASVELSNLQHELSEVKHEIDNQTSELNRTYADIKRLRFNASAVQAVGSEISTVTVSTRKCDGETITEFSGKLFEAIYTEFGKCDKIVEQLTSAQKVIVLDRKIVNE